MVALLLVVAMLGLVGCSGTALHMPTPPGLGGSAQAKLATAAFKFVLSGVGSGILSWGAKQGMGWLLGLTDQDEGDVSQEMLDKMDEMDAKLDQIIDMVEELSQQLDQILAAIQSGTDKIIANNDALEIENQLDTVKYQYSQLKPFDRSRAGTADGRQDAQAFADDVLNSSKLDIPLQLYQIHSGIIGDTPGTGGALVAWTNYLIDKLDAGEDMMDCYLTLEGYFAALLNTQAKGLTLVVEALHQRDGVNGSAVSPADFYGTAEQYLNDEFKPHVATQVDEFLVCVERLLIHQAEVTTNAANPTNPANHADPPHPDAADMFFRADFLAAQASDAHPFGLVVRLIGEPDAIAAYAQNKQVTGGGNTLDVVQVVGKDVRLYDVVNWPGHFKQHKYMQWEWTDEGHWDGWNRFKEADQIAVAKFAGPGKANYVMYTRAPHEPTYEPRVKCWNADLLGTGGDDCEVYANCLFPVRHSPSWHVNYREVMDSGGCNGEDSWDITFDNGHGCAPPYVGHQAKTACDNRGNLCKQMFYSHYHAMSLCFISGCGNDRKVVIKGKIKREATRSCDHMWLSGDRACMAYKQKEDYNDCRDFADWFWDLKFESHVSSIKTSPMPIPDKFDEHWNYGTYLTVGSFSVVGYAAMFEGHADCTGAGEWIKAKVTVEEMEIYLD